MAMERDHRDRFDVADQNLTRDADPASIRLARLDESDAINRLMKDSIGGIFPPFCDGIPMPDGVTIAGASMTKPIETGLGRTVGRW